MSSFSCNSTICHYSSLLNPTFKPMYNMPTLYKIKNSSAKSKNEALAAAVPSWS